MSFFARYFTILSALLCLVIGGCGGNNSSSPANNIDAVQSTGTVGLLITDQPTDQLSAVNLDITQAILIGDSGQQPLFDGNIRVNMLDLARFNQPIAFGTVQAGSYHTLQLQLANLELIDRDGNAFYPALPANGEINIRVPDGINVVPERTLLADIDFDAAKSIKDNGNGSYSIRPVVKVRFLDGELPDKMARLEGVVSEMLDPATRRILLCASDNADVCMVVNLADDGCTLDDDGLVASFEALAVDDEVTVIGRYHRSDIDVANASSDYELDALVIVTAPTSQVRGAITSAAVNDGYFFLLSREELDMRVEIHPGCTRVRGDDAEVLTTNALQVGASIAVDGVINKPFANGEPTILRAALIFIDGNDNAEQLNGTVILPIEEPDFTLATAGGDVCVTALAGALITVLSATPAEIRLGGFVDIVAGSEVEVYGSAGSSGCFEASEILIQL